MGRSRQRPRASVRTKGAEPERITEIAVVADESPARRELPQPFRYDGTHTDVGVGFSGRGGPPNGLWLVAM